MDAILLHKIAAGFSSHGISTKRFREKCVDSIFTDSSDTAEKGGKWFGKQAVCSCENGKFGGKHKREQGGKYSLKPEKKSAGSSLKGNFWEK